MTATCWRPELIFRGSVRRASIALCALAFAACPNRAPAADQVEEFAAFQYYRLALSALERGDLEKAESRLAKVTSFASDWAQGGSMLGFVRECLGRPGPAAEAYQKALAADPRNAFAWHSLRKLGAPLPGDTAPTGDAKTWETYRAGLVLLTQQQVDEGIRTVFEAARAAPDWLEIRNTLAYLYEMHRTQGDAVREVQAVLDLAPQDLYARQALTQLRPDEAARQRSTAPTDGLKYPQWAGDETNAQFERQLFALVNEERRKRGLNELLPDETLTKIAREHAAEMREKGFFAHESPTPGRREPLDRYMLYETRKPQTIAENVARRWGSRPSLNESNIRGTHADLMQSSHHRANILREGLTHLGIGVASNGQGDFWVTEVFAKPR